MTSRAAPAASSAAAPGGTASTRSAAVRGSPCQGVPASGKPSSSGQSKPSTSRCSRSLIRSRSGTARAARTTRIREQRLDQRRPQQVRLPGGGRPPAGHSPGRSRRARPAGQRHGRRRQGGQVGPRRARPEQAEAARGHPAEEFGGGRLAGERPGAQGGPGAPRGLRVAAAQQLATVASGLGWAAGRLRVRSEPDPRFSKRGQHRPPVRRPARPREASPPRHVCASSGAPGGLGRVTVCSTPSVRGRGAGTTLGWPANPWVRARNGTRAAARAAATSLESLPPVSEQPAGPPRPAAERSRPAPRRPPPLPRALRPAPPARTTVTRPSADRSSRSPPRARTPRKGVASPTG